MWRLSVLFLILSSVSTQFSGYLTNKAFTEEFCYNFFTNWENTEKVPGHAQVILSKCEKGEVIRIDKAEFIRPDSRGDDCGTTQTCCPATEDDCQQDIEQSYETLYQSIRNNCDEHNGCHINVPAFKTDSECGGYFIWSKCRTKTGANFDIDTSCYPRRIKIYYACLYRGDVIPPTKTVTIATTKLPITARTTVKSGKYTLIHTVNKVTTNPSGMYTVILSYYSSHKAESNYACMLTNIKFKVRVLCPVQQQGSY